MRRPYSTVAEVAAGRRRNENPLNPATAYQGIFFSPAAERVLRLGRIIPPEMNAAQLVDRVLSWIDQVESEKETSEKTDEVLNELDCFIRDGVVSLGSPLLTNVAHGDERPVASCSAIPFTAKAEDFRTLVERYYKDNMGSGFNLDSFDEPVAILQRLNAHAEMFENSGACERYIGNIAHLDIDHPRIVEFITAKVLDQDIRHFNISVNLNDEFMRTVEEGGIWRLRNGVTLSARSLWRLIAESAHASGDPGIIALDRLNAHNALRATNPYTTVAPCAEVGLADGESCIFGYISLAPLVVMDDLSSSGSFDFARLAAAARVLTRVLDNAVEHSSRTQSAAASQWQHLFGRKVAIGICGYADALMLLGLPYGSPKATEFLRDCIATINFESKTASMELAERRGSFLGFKESEYAKSNSWVERFAASPSRIEERQWHQLANRIQRLGLRNAMTSALPPSGRVSLLLGVSASIEPYLRFDASSEPLSLQIVHSWLASSRELDWPSRSCTASRRFKYDDVVRTAYGISIDRHLRTVSAAAAFVDDGISKTLNLDESASSSDIDRIFTSSWESGLKAMSVYRRDSATLRQMSLT